MLFAPIRLAIRLATLVVIAAVVYLIVCTVQVVTASRLPTNPAKVQTASAIVIIDSPAASSAANGDMAARLKWVSRLYASGRAKSVVVIATPSESQGAMLDSAVHSLRTEGVPSTAIVKMRSSSVTHAFSDAAGRFGHRARVIIVTDAIDALWTEGASTADGLRVEISSPPISQKIVFSEINQLWRQASAVAVGRAIGFGRTTWAAS